MSDEKIDEKSGAQAHAHPHIHQLHQRGRRIRQFLRPDGRRIHIASSPDEIDGLRRALSMTEDGEFDVVIHGSPEHIDALRETHSHSERSRELLRKRHGEEFDELERIVHQVDDLANELYMVSESAVQLNANFSKFGYSAHLRTRESPNASSANSLKEGDSALEHDWEADKKRGQTMRFWKKPVVRQYLHKGLLWRAEDEAQVASFELFVDLFYVGIIAISGDNAAEHATGRSLLGFAITFTLAWKFWSDISMFIAWFDSDDILRRINVLVSLACLLGMTTNIAEALDETYTPLIAFYLTARMLRAVHFCWLAYMIPMVRACMIANMLSVVIPAALWIGSIHVEEPKRQALIWIALPLDMFGYFLLIGMQRKGKCLPGPLGKWCETAFDFQPALNIEHKIERTNAFVALVFGYSVVALLYQSRVEFGINAFFGKAVLGMVQSFTYNWIYFEIDSFNLHTHAIRRHMISSLVWVSIHLPFIMAFVLSGASLSKLVLAHDCEDTDPHSLWEVYEERSEEHITEGQRWFYCAGLGIALACMSIISATHIHKDIVSARLLKRYRLTLRLVVSLILILLPLAGERLNSLELISTTTCLVLIVLITDLVGMTCSKEGFWVSGRKGCTYATRCHLSKRDFEASLKSGEALRVEEIAQNEKGHTAGMHM